MDRFCWIWRRNITFDEAVLSEMVSMIRGVKDVSVVQLAVGRQVREDALDGGVDALQRLQTLRHQQVGESVVHWFHFVHLETSSSLKMRR